MLWHRFVCAGVRAVCVEYDRGSGDKLMSMGMVMVVKSILVIEFCCGAVLFVPRFFVFGEDGARGRPIDFASVTSYPLICYMTHLPDKASTSNVKPTSIRMVGVIPVADIAVQPSDHYGLLARFQMGGATA